MALGMITVLPSPGLLTSAVATVASGWTVGHATSESMRRDAASKTKAGAPPPYVFWVAWSLIYALVGVQAGTARSPEARLHLYVNLAVNLSWPLVAEISGADSRTTLAVLLWILADTWYLVLVERMTLLLPYALWMVFATWLMLQRRRVDAAANK